MYVEILPYGVSKDRNAYLIVLIYSFRQANQNLMRSVSVCNIATGTLKLLAVNFLVIEYLFQLVNLILRQTLVYAKKSISGIMKRVSVREYAHQTIIRQANWQIMTNVNAQLTLNGTFIFRNVL